MSIDDVRELLLAEARKCEPQPWRSTGIAKWCTKHGVNRGHVSEFMNGKRAPTSDVLEALGLEWRIESKGNGFPATRIESEPQ